MEYCSDIKKNEIMPSAATWMDPEIIILSKSDRERQIPYDLTYMWNLKQNKKTLSLQRTDWWFPGVGDGRNG